MSRPKRPKAIHPFQLYPVTHSYQNPNGYISAYQPDHPYCQNKGYVLIHRLIMEKQLNRWLHPFEIVHHKNGIRTDNRLNNLEILGFKEHAKIPNTGQFTSSRAKHFMNLLWGKSHQKSQTCKTCGKKFLEFNSRIKLGRGQYCSRKCRILLVSLVCVTCHKSFIVHNCRKNQAKFCSRICRRWKRKKSS